jgi:hypothetical protein
VRAHGLPDAEITMLIGDRTGTPIIATMYGDVRPDHLLKQAQRIRPTVQKWPVSNRQRWEWTDAGLSDG